MKRTCEKWCNQSQVELIEKIHIDYHIIYIYIYMSSYWHNILTISPRCVNRNLPGGDNKITVNTSTTPHISDQLGTENACETLLYWFIVMIWAPVCENMYRYGRHFGSFYHDPTILETVSIAWVNSTRIIFFYWNTTTWNNLSPMCLC